MIKEMILPMFCLTHMTRYDIANKFGCVECYIEEEIADVDPDEIDEYGDTVVTAKQELGDELTEQRVNVVEKIMRHIDDCVDGIGDKEELSAGIDEEIKTYIENCVEWS